VAARRFGAVEIVDPKPYAVGKLADTFRMYPNVGQVLPAMGYGEEQIGDLTATIEATDCDAVVIATPIDLARIVKIGKPCTRVEYSLQEIGKPDMEDVLAGFIEKAKRT
jgi:predicted GTPase